jgi:hypothetical protein
MGEERIGALNTSAQKELRQTTMQSAAGADAGPVPAFDTPLPAAIPKPKLPLPITSSSTSNTGSLMGTKDFPEMAKGHWNTSKLGLRVGVDALAAGAAGALVAPIITMIDKGIIENASGRNTLGESLKQSARELLLRPHRFIASKPFALIFVRPSLSSSTTTILTPTLHRVFTSVPTSPQTQSIQPPPPCTLHPLHPPPPEPPNSLRHPPPTLPSASTKTTNSPSSLAPLGLRALFPSLHSLSSQSATASPSSQVSISRRY